MTKSLRALITLSTCISAAPLLMACATQDARSRTIEGFSADDCKSYGLLFNDPNLNRSIAGLNDNPINSGGGLNTSSNNSEDKITLPWDRSHEANVSRERASLRKVHKQKGCAE